MKECCEGVLPRSVVEKFCGEVLEKSVVEKCCEGVLGRCVGCEGVLW